MYKRTLFACLASTLIFLFTDVASATMTQPKFTIIPTIPVRNILTSVAQYRVTNQTKITRSLTIVPIQGVSQIIGGINSCGTVFTLAQGESCLLTLTSSTTISDTPVQVCKTNYNDNNPDPFLCSQTSPEDNLNLSPSSPTLEARLVSLPKTLNLTAGSSTQGVITVSNLSSVFAATNVQADLTGTALDGNVTQDASACTALPALGQCDIYFTPGNQPVSLTSFPIEGDNTTQAAGAIIITDASTARITVTSGNPLILDEGGNGTLTIQNNSSVSATDVAADLSELQNPTALTQNSSGCATLAANGSCQLQFTANSVLSAEAMFIFGTNTSTTASGVAVNASSQIQLQITAGSPLQLQADGSTTGTMTIQNLSTTETAENVTANFTNTSLSGKVTATTCTSIAPQATCNITYTPSIYTAVPTNFTIVGSNTAAVTGNLSINSYKALIVNSGSSGSSTAVICDLSQSTGQLSNCKTMSGLPSLSSLTGVAFNLAADHVYFVSSFSPTVTDCDFNPNSTSLSNCKNTTVTSASGQNNGNGVVYNPFLGTIFVTVSDSSTSSGNSRVYQCSLNSSNQVTSCSNTGADNINYPTGISLNSTGDVAYIGNFDSSNSMVNCDVSLSDGSFSSCNQNTGIGSQKNGVAVNPEGTYVYAAQQNSNNLVYCTVDSSDNSISSCTTVSIIGSGALNPYGVALNPVTSYLYVTVASQSEVQLCVINSSDEIGSCSVNPSIGNLGFSTGIALFPTPPQ